MSDRRYAPQEEWESIALSALTTPAVREGALKARGDVQAYHVKAVVEDEEQTLELVWFGQSGRAAVASSQGVVWTDAPTPEAALRAWASDRLRGTRLRPR